MTGEVSKAGDRGSALPLFIFGCVTLLLLGAVLLRSGQLLEQQRRLSGVSDTIALSLEERAAGAQIGDEELASWAADDISLIYSGQAIEVDSAHSSHPGRVSVRVCQPSLWTPVCAASSAETR